MIKQFRIFIIFCTLLFINLNVNAQLNKVSKVRTLMGSRFDFSIVHTDSIVADRYIDTMITEVKRIEYLLSDWIDTTQVSMVNKYAGIAPVKVDKEVIDLTQKAIEISKLTDGAFDITFAAMEKIWKFDGSMTQMPTAEIIKKAVSKVGYQKIVIDTIWNTIFLSERGMKIGFGALGEGYAADKCRDILTGKGILNGMINGSGDIRAWGTEVDGGSWNIGLTDPFDPLEIKAIIPIKDEAITTSGSYEKYAEIDGVRYAHIINPKTGYPATGLISVTILGPSALFANALSTSIMVMGQEKGLDFLKSFPEYKCIMITDSGEFVTTPNISITDYLVD